MVNSTGESNDLKFSMLTLTSTKHTSIRIHYSINKKKFSILFRYLTKKSPNRQIIFNFCAFCVKSKGSSFVPAEREHSKRWIPVFAIYKGLQQIPLFAVYGMYA